MCSGAASLAQIEGSVHVAEAFAAPLDLAGCGRAPGGSAKMPAKVPAKPFAFNQSRSFSGS